MAKELVDIECVVVKETDDAIAICDGTEEVVNGHKEQRWFWLPKKYAEVDKGSGRTIVTLPVWLAEAKGLV